MIQLHLKRYLISSNCKYGYDTLPFFNKKILNSTKNKEELENFKELISLQNQVTEVRLQGKLGQNNFHEDMKKVCEPITKSIKDVSEEVAKTVTESSIKNNQALENLNNKLLVIMNDRVILAFYLLSLLSNKTNAENFIHSRLVKDHNSIESMTC